MEVNSVDAWNVRPMPSAAMSDGAQRRSECPFNRMSPRTGRYSLLRQLNSVVLPAPLGPIKPTILPRATAKVTSWRATMPPKCIATPAISNNAETAPLPEPAAALGRLSVMPLDAPSTLLSPHALMS